MTAMKEAYRTDFAVLVSRGEFAVELAEIWPKCVEASQR